MQNIYGECEIEYTIKIVKSKGTKDDPALQSSERQDELLEIYEKSLDTLEVLMSKLGLKDQFQRVMDNYDEDMASNLQTTLLKVLTRCKIMYVSLHKIQTIFKLINKRLEMLNKISYFESQLGSTPELEGQLEEQIAQFCFHSSRLFIQITSFMIESLLFKRHHFIYEGEDYQEKIRQSVAELREKYSQRFSAVIPEMNSRGKLIFGKEDESSDVESGK